MVYYKKIELSSDAIERADYKALLGGGSAQWEARGAFQLHFLIEMGMLPSHRLFDAGCGPARAGVFFIDYLADGNYYGLDQNAGFIAAARKVVEGAGLSAKNPAFDVADDFAPKTPVQPFQFAIAFSVLNHCREFEREAFFRSVLKNMCPGGRTYITHAGWFTDTHINNTRWQRGRTFTSQDFDLRARGWPEGANVFPIVELIS